MNEQEKNALCKSVYKNESYTIGQLSKLAGVSTRTLRYYEDQGLLASARDKNGYRRYSSRDAKKTCSNYIDAFLRVAFIGHQRDIWWL